MAKLPFASTIGSQARVSSLYLLICVLVPGRVMNTPARPAYTEPAGPLICSHRLPLRRHSALWSGVRV